VRKNSFGCHCDPALAGEAPIKRPLSREKKFPKREFLVSGHSANDRHLNSGRRSPLPMPKFLLERCQRPSWDFAAPSTHQDLGQRMGIFWPFRCVCDFGTRALSRTKITDYPDPSVYRRTRKSSVPNRVQRDRTISWLYQLRMAHGLGSKDADLLMQREGMGPQSIFWFHQLRSGVPIPPKSVV